MRATDKDITFFYNLFQALRNSGLNYGNDDNNYILEHFITRDINFIDFIHRNFIR